MNTTLSMWLGITFVGLGIAAVLLQAWLWNPKYWDPVAKKTNAPRAGLRLHRWVGIAFTVIYVFMMWHMLPRLWEYQVELPARTVIHAVAAILLGVLLATKLIILRWFRHFEESMPLLGFGIMACTITLGTLSIPYAARAHGVGVDVMSDENVERVTNLLAEVEFPDGTDREALITPSGLDRGRRVLVEQCTLCHDMRTILAKPRPADAWYDVSERMAEKPSVFGNPLDAEDLPFVAAYLTAITPEIQASKKRENEAKRERAAMMAEMAAAMVVPMPAAPAPTMPAPTTPAPMPAVEMVDPFTVPPTPALAPAKAKKLTQTTCTQCHELDELDKHGPDDAKGWAKVVREMIEEGAEISEMDAQAIVAQLVATRGKK